MQTRALLCLALAAAASAFTAPAMGGRMQLRSSQAAISMKAGGFQLPAGVKKAMAPAIAALSIAAPAFAEGTGEAIGIDDGRLLIPLLLIPTIVFVVYQGFASDQDNEDFFDTYDQRRK